MFAWMREFFRKRYEDYLFEHWRIIIPPFYEEKPLPLRLFLRRDRNFLSRNGGNELILKTQSRSFVMKFACFALAAALAFAMSSPADARGKHGGHGHGHNQSRGGPVVGVGAGAAAQVGAKLNVLNIAKVKAGVGLGLGLGLGIGGR
ncbi:MAG TPA: hypothetical protein PK857_04455 [Hyphomicrobium sp.]|nr:hypothetical protein [Hyphomicrobium sp.]